MTRQERLQALEYAMSCAWTDGNASASMARGGIETRSRLGAVDAASWGHEALDHLAALEQQAITDYLADVPLPKGWTEEDDGEECRYWEVVDGFPVPVERVIAGKRGMKILSFHAHWPAIPQAVLVRAVVQCGRLREVGR